MRGLPRRLTAGLLFAVFLLSVYRAKTQSFTVDEAYTFRLFVNQDLTVFLRQFDACNHVLHTLLTKFFRTWVGVSELELRLGSLLGCLIYLAATWRLVQLYFGARWLQVLAAALLVLNPLVMDFFVASRGYGLGLGLFLWAMYGASSYWMRGQDPNWLWRAGVLAGLSIAANLTMLVPATALGLVLLILAGRHGARGWGRVVDHYGGPALILAALFVIMPLLRAAADNFYFGARTVREALFWLVQPSLLKNNHRVLSKWIAAADPVIERLVIPALATLLAAAALVVMVRFLRGITLPYRLAPFALFAGTFTFSLLLIWLLRLRGVQYPMGRTGLYLIPLFSMALACAATLFDGVPWLRRTVAAVAGAIVLVYLTQVEVRYFAEWRFDSSTARLLRVLHQNQAIQGRPGHRPDIGISVILEHSIEYYRIRRNLDWLGRIISERELLTTPADYYILTLEDASLVQRFNLEVVDRDRISEVVLARRRP